MYDLVIKNANLIDGLGNAMRQASVAVQKGRIVAIDDAELGAARQEIDAGGLTLAPGIIDHRRRRHAVEQIGAHAEASSSSSVSSCA